MNKKSVRVYIVFIIIIAIVVCGGIYRNLNQSIYNTELYNEIGIDKSLLNILYFNVGQGDSTFIMLGDKTMLIDAGNPSDGYYISEFLKAQNIDKIDYLIGTHIDDDHIGRNV